MIFLNEEQVRPLLQMETLIPAMADALRELSSDKVQQPLRVVLPVAEHNGFFGVMPAYAAARCAIGAKLVTYFPGNETIPTHHAIIQLFRPETGEPLVTMDGRLITEMRTAAVSAVATDLLARRNVASLAILGAGVQARSHLRALCLVRNFTEVRVWSPRRAREFARSCAQPSAPSGFVPASRGEEASANDSRPLRVIATNSPEMAVRGADVIVVATSATTPVLKGEWLSPGAHINAVGATRPAWRELDDAVLRQSKIYVESREAAMKESGDIIAAGGNSVEIGHVLAGASAARETDQEITLFKSVGVAVEDIAAADLVLQQLEARTSANALTFDQLTQPAQANERPRGENSIE